MSYYLIPLVFTLGLPAITTGQSASHGTPDGGEKPLTTPSPAQAPELLSQLQTNSDPETRRSIAKQLMALGPDAVPEILKFLNRKRTSTEAQRRETLGKINAEVPDAKGRFRTPGRRTKKERQAADNLDWFAHLLSAPASPALPDVIADVVALRALAASKTDKGAEGLLDFAFSRVGLIYRDECGRYLRKMAPYSVPALIRANGTNKKKPLWGYARYQLERLDRQSAPKALASARFDERLTLEVLEAFAAIHYRDAVAVILATTNDVSPRVRAAARKAWLAYVTGPEPPEAPKRRLLKPGRRLSSVKVPLWLNYRQRAEIELDATLTRILGTAPTETSLEKKSQQLFDHYDQKRAHALEGLANEAQQALDRQDYPKAVNTYDRLLVQDPKTSKRPKIADAYIAYAKSLAEKKDFIGRQNSLQKHTQLHPMAHRPSEHWPLITSTSTGRACNPQRIAPRLTINRALLAAPIRNFATSVGCSWGPLVAALLRC